MWANELWENSKMRICAIKQPSDSSHSPNWAMRKGISGYETQLAEVQINERFQWALTLAFFQSKKSTEFLSLGEVPW